VTSSLSVWLVIGLALAAANLPFFSQRLFCIVRPARPKPLHWRLFELLVYYFVVGGISLLLEQHAGQIAPQGWEFYAITGTLFVTFAFPGFVYRYLLKHHLHA
jgi:hypothetical protein